jgi:hypothetical protein
MTTINTKLAILGLVLLMPGLALAETVVRTGHSVSIADTQTVENDFYAAGSSVTHSGTVKEDLYVVAGSMTVNGTVGEDLTIIGGTAQIHAPIGDDVRVVGGDVVIAGKVGGDVFVIGGLLRVLSSAEIAGNVYFYGGEADIEGVVKGSLMGRAEAFVLNSEAGGVDVSAVRMELGDRAVVRGDLRYTGVSEIERAAGAVVEGEVIHGTEVAATEDGGNAGLVFVLAWAFTTLCFFLLLRSQVEELLADIKREPMRVGLIGVAVLIGAPVLSVVLLATVLGAWIGFVMLLLTVLLFILCLILMPILLGGYLSNILFKGRRLDILSVVMGILAVMLLSYVPILGGLLIAASFLITLGAISYIIYQRVRNIG